MIGITGTPAGKVIMKKVTPVITRDTPRSVKVVEYQFFICSPQPDTLQRLACIRQARFVASSRQAGVARVPLCFLPIKRSLVELNRGRMFHPSVHIHQ